LEKIKHGFKTLAECGGIHGFDDTSSYVYKNVKAYIKGKYTTESIEETTKCIVLK
jgi:hypothetical protein